jgi:hypothetical protein
MPILERWYGLEGVVKLVGLGDNGNSPQRPTIRMAEACQTVSILVSLLLCSFRWRRWDAKGLKNTCFLRMSDRKDEAGTIFVRADSRQSLWNAKQIIQPVDSLLEILLAFKVQSFVCACW